MLRSFLGKISHRLTIYKDLAWFFLNDPKLSFDITKRKIKTRIHWENFREAIINKSPVYYDGIKLPFYSQLGNDQKELEKIGILSDIFMQNYERDVLQFYRNHLKEGDIVIDIGANLGVTAAYAAMCVKEKGSIYCFEPVDYLHNTLLAIKEANNTYSFNIENLALADYEGEAEINVTKPPQIAGHTLSKEFADKQVIAETQRIKVIPFDKFADENNLIGKIQLIKIDVEGFELEVLRGMKRTLMAKLPIIIFEIMPSIIASRKQTIKDFENLLSEKYDFYKMQNLDKKIMLNNLKIRTNVVCMPKWKQNH